VAEQSAAMVGGDNSDDDTPPVSCCGVVTPYSQFRAVLSPIDFTLRLTARTTIWMDTLKMSASTQSMLVSGCKSFDFLLGFVMAKLTDSHVPESIRTRFGRRRPFIAIFFPLGLVFFVIFCNATWFFETEKVDRPCANLTIDAEEPGANASFCPQLRMCLDEAIAEGRLFAPGNTTMPANMSRLAGGPSGGALATLFVITYFGFIFCTWTSVQIPYDALGMELTEKYHERTFLFSMKALFQFIGYILSPVVQIVLGSVLGANNLIQITSLRSIIFACLGLASQMYLISMVRERPAPAKPPDVVPPVVSVRRALANKPYVQYLKMKVPLTLFSLIPSNMLSFYIRYILALEDWIVFEGTVLIVALVGGLGSIPMTLRLASYVGDKGKTLAIFLTLEGILFIVFTCIPYTVYRENAWITFLVGFFVGLGTTLAFILPDAILNDIVDYDELKTGERNEALYAVVETNLQQAVETVGGILPLMILGATGYEPLGGCDCGCGIPCDTQEGMPYARWICPDNVGYSCTGAIESTLLYAPEPDVIPCASQDDGVLWTIIIFMLGIPGVLGLLAAYFATKQLITHEMHEVIRKQVAATKAGGDSKCVDPITHEPCVLPGNTEADLMLEHWSPKELAHARKGGLKRLQYYVGGRLGLWVALTAILLSLMGVVSGDGQLYVVTLGFLALAVLFVLIPWDCVKLHLLFTPSAESLAHLESVDQAIASTEGGRGASVEMLPPQSPLPSPPASKASSRLGGSMSNPSI